MDIHLYAISSRFEALIASHLDPEAFGLYMAVGTKKLAAGHVLFFEIDPGLKSDHFRLHDLAQRCAPHADGSPKRSKYISGYRVLEFLPLQAFRKLYVTTPDGRVLALEPTAYDVSKEEEGPALYQELCPLTPLVVSRLPPSRFGKFMTDPENPVSCPRLAFADLRVDRDASGHLAGDLPYPDRLHIEDCIRQLGEGAGKATKTVSRTPRTQFSFLRVIRRGFFLSDQTGLKYYRYPTREEMEIRHAAWWHSAAR